MTNLYVKKSSKKITISILFPFRFILKYNSSVTHHNIPHNLPEYKTGEISSCDDHKDELSSYDEENIVCQVDERPGEMFNHYLNIL